MYLSSWIFGAHVLVILLVPNDSRFRGLQRQLTAQEFFKKKFGLVALRAKAVSVAALGKTVLLCFSV